MGVSGELGLSDQDVESRCSSPRSWSTTSDRSSTSTLSLTHGGKVRRWTFLLGENGTGKTTLLQAIALVMAGSAALPELLGDPAEWVRHERPAVRIRAEFRTAAGEQRTAELVIESRDSIRTLYERNAASLQQLDAALAHTPRSWFTVGYGVTRTGSDLEILDADELERDLISAQ